MAWERISGKLNVGIKISMVWMSLLICSSRRPGKFAGLFLGPGPIAVRLSHLRPELALVISLPDDLGDSQVADLGGGVHIDLRPNLRGFVTVEDVLPLFRSGHEIGGLHFLDVVGLE